MDPASLLTAMGETYVTDFLRAKSAALLHRWQNDRAGRPRLLYETAYDMLRGAGHAQLDVAAQTLLKYYANTLEQPPADARFPQYHHLSGTTIHLPLVSQAPWIAAVESGLAVQEAYVSPQSRPFRDQVRDSRPPFRELLGFDFTNGDIFNLRSLNLLGNQLHLEFTESKFLPWRDTYGDLQDEFIMQLPVIFQQGRNARPKFNLRNRLLPNLSSVFDVSRRHSAGGVVVLTVLPGPDGDAEILVEPRSGEVTDGQSLLTTIPRGFHDSFAKARGDYALATTVFREVVEEIFCGAPSKTGQTSTRAYLHSCPPVADLLNSGAFVLHPTGVLFDLLKGNYTFTYLLLVTDPDWWPKYQGHQKLNNEFQLDGQASSFNLSWTEEITSLTARSDWTFEGYYAFVEGLRALPALAQRNGMDTTLVNHAHAAGTLLPQLTWLSPHHFRQ